MERLREENEALLSQLEEYQEEYRERLSEWNIERLRLQAQMNEVRSSDLEVLRDHEALYSRADRILKSLKLGVQSAQYKAAKKALDQLIRELRREL